MRVCHLKKRIFVLDFKQKRRYGTDAHQLYTFQVRDFSYELLRH